MWENQCQMSSLFCFSKTKALILTSWYIFIGTLPLFKERDYVWKQLKEAFVLGWGHLILKKLDGLLSQWSSFCPGPQFCLLRPTIWVTGIPTLLSEHRHLLSDFLTLMNVHPSSLQSLHPAERLKEGFGRNIMMFNCKSRWPPFF